MMMLTQTELDAVPLGEDGGDVMRALTQQAREKLLAEKPPQRDGAIAEIKRVEKTTAKERAKLAKAVEEATDVVADIEKQREAALRDLQQKNSELRSFDRQAKLARGALLRTSRENAPPHAAAARVKVDELIRESQKLPDNIDTRRYQQIQARLHYLFDVRRELNSEDFDLLTYDQAIKRIDELLEKVPGGAEPASA